MILKRVKAGEDFLCLQLNLKELARIVVLFLDALERMKLGECGVMIFVLFCRWWCVIFRSAGVRSQQKILKYVGFRFS